jgi:hypothetical protein
LRWGLKRFGDRAVESHISPKTSEIWGTADSGYKCNISTIGDSCVWQGVFVIWICLSE